MFWNSFDVWECLLFAYMPDQHLGWKKYSGLLFFPFEVSVLSPLWPWMLPWRPESSLVNGHLLFMPGLLRTCYFLIELKLLNQDISLCWEFWVNFFSLSLGQYILWIQSSLHFRQCYVLSNTFCIHYFSIPFFNFFVSGMLITCGFFFINVSFIMHLYLSFGCSVSFPLQEESPQTGHPSLPRCYTVIFNLAHAV